MNWLKIGIFGVAAPVIHTLDQVLTSNISGQHVPITSGTILLPSVPVLAGLLIALFTPHPKQS